MKRTLNWTNLLIASLLLLVVSSCNPKTPQKGPEVQKEEEKESLFKTPFLKKGATAQEVAEWEKKNGGTLLEESDGDGYTQVTYQTTKAPAIAHSYVFKAGQLDQVIALWSPYTKVFKEQKDTELTKEFQELLLKSGYSDLKDKVGEFETINIKKNIRLIITPATLSVEKRDLVAKLVFLFEDVSSGNVGGEDTKVYPDPILPKLLVPLCSSPDMVTEAEKKANSKVLKDSREVIAGYIQQEFEVNEKINGVTIARRMYLTKAENKLLKIAAIVLVPQGSYWKRGYSDYNKKIIDLIKAEGYIDTGLGKTDDTHYFYKVQDMEDGLSYTHVMIQRNDENRYVEIKEPSVEITYSRSNMPPVNTF